MRFALMQQYYNGPDYLKRLQARVDVMKMMERDPFQRQRYILDVWAVDPIAFIEDVCFLKLPEFNNEIKPFFLFEYQKKIIWKLMESEQSGADVELLIDKLRGMGMTWLLSCYIYWRWLYTPNWSGFILSRTETEVDDGTDVPDNCIFGKIRFLIKYTPKWMLPEGFTPKGKKGTSTDSTLRLLNPALGSSIMGSSTNANAGRSRRYSFIFIDECFYIERFREVWRSLQSVARVKVFVSSVKAGKINKDFKDMCAEAGNYFSLTWKDHPWKDQEWYDEQMKKAEFDDEVLKEVEVGYIIGVRSQYYPEIAKARVEEVFYNRKLPLYCFLDIGRQDLTVIGWMQFDGANIFVVEAYANRNKPLDWYVPFLNPEIQNNPDKYNDYQKELLNKIRSWQKPIGYFGEQAHFVKVMPSNTSVAQELIKFHIRLMYNQYAIAHEPRRHATASLLPKTVFNKNSDHVLELYDGIANSRYTNSVSATSKQTVLKPVHDPEIADYRSAFENGMVNIARVIRRQREDIASNLNDGRFVTGLIKYLKI